MKKFRNFRNKKKRLSSKYLLMILSGVCVVAIFTSLVLNISGGPLNSIAGYVFVPMQEGINNAGSWLSSKANDFKTLGEVLTENKELKSQIDDLTTQLNKTKLEQYDLDNYRQLLDLADQYANERSIIYDSSNDSAIVMTTKDNFNVSGSLMSMNKDKVLPFTELRDENNKVKQGDPVVTSYVSDQYQQGLLIGYIYSIEDNPNNLTKSGYITPVVDFQHLQEVLVITEIKNTGKGQTSSTEDVQDTQN